MTRLRIGSGGSALSLAFAAGLGAAGGFAAGTAPALAIGGAGVLPSTGSAIFPLLDLSISIINRDYRRTKFLETVFRYNFLYFRNPLPVKANSDFWSYLCTCLVYAAVVCILAEGAVPGMQILSKPVLRKKISTQRAQRTQ